MRKVIGLAIGLAALAGPAHAADRAWPVAGFDQVRVAGPFDVRIATGGAHRVTAKGPQAAIDHIVVEVQGGALVVRSDGASWKAWRGWFSRDEPLVVTVSMPAIRGVALTGSGDVSVDRVRGPAFRAELTGSGDVVVNDVQAQTVALALTGSGDLTARGRAGRVTAELGGSGDVRAGDLMAQDATLALRGSGDLTLGVRRAATVSLIGSGDVTVTGGAHCTTSKRGSGDVHCG